MTRYRLAAAVIVILALGLGAAAGRYPPRPGSAHPELTLRSVTDGKLVSLSDFRGKKLLLINFASW